MNALPFVFREKIRNPVLRRKTQELPVVFPACSAAHFGCKALLLPHCTACSSIYEVIVGDVLIQL